MTTDEKLDLLLSIGEEVTTKEELREFLQKGKHLITYDGFEPSGQMHIAQGIMRAINTNKMIKAGFTFRMLVADWYAYLNNKMGGDLEKIKTVGRYFIEIWRASGMDLDHTEFLWTSDFVGDRMYWETVMKVAKSSTLNRILRTTEIMGRSEQDRLTAAQIMYPCMQAADVFYAMEARVTQLGMDQRKVNMLARQVGDELGFWKPIVISNHMLMGLQPPHKVINDETNVSERRSEISSTMQRRSPEEVGTSTATETRNFVPNELEEKSASDEKIAELIAMKMSKSNPDSAIFMTDTHDDIERKIRKAYCPEGEVETNPVLEYCRYIIFEAHHLKGQETLLKNGFEIERPEKFGGDVRYRSYPELESAFAAKELYPLDLKNAVVKYLDILIQPVRTHFEQNGEAKELLKQVQSFQVTR